MSIFQPLEAVDRGSEAQPRVDENLKKINSGFNILFALFITAFIYYFLFGIFFNF